MGMVSALSRICNTGHVQTGPSSKWSQAIDSRLALLFIDKYSEFGQVTDLCLGGS